MIDRQQRAQYEDATQLTGDHLRTIAQTSSVSQLSSLTLPEINRIVDRIARIAPAGNVPGFILNGLLRRNRSQPQQTRANINLLFKGIEQSLRDKAVFSVFYAGPAAVLWTYQALLKMAGLNPDTSFPEGTWQFYVDYALRDDTARHACETIGFDATLRQHNIVLSTADRLTAWAMTAVFTLHHYDRLLENEWRERVATDRLAQAAAHLPHAAEFAGLYRRWENQRPYRRGSDVDPRQDYAAYRRQKFDSFLAPWLDKLPAAVRRQWHTAVSQATATELPAYQRQMTICATLDPDPYGERRVPIELKQLHVGIIYDGRYYLLPICRDDDSRPVDAAAMRAQIAALLAHPADTPAHNLSLLAGVRRAHHASLRQSLSAGDRRELELLRLAPIWLHADPRPARQPLAAIRQVERAIGDHPLTIFDTGASTVFDLSHIFFDGALGVALAEVMTNEALSWAAYLRTLPPAQPGRIRPYAPRLNLPDSIRHYPRVATEASAETDRTRLSAILELRRALKKRSTRLRLTVNDLLVLYRAIHAASYRPNADLMTRLQTLKKDPATRAAANAALAALPAAGRLTPAILIPVDATRHRPAERVYPLTFEVPLHELNLLNLHRDTVNALTHAQKRRRSRQRWRDFAELQHEYLGVLAGFGALMAQVKDTAIRGESVSVKNIKLLANLPLTWQRLLDDIPNRFDLLNDLIKGREVFSNVGQMAPGSSVTRFITAKDDNEKKTLAWGVLSDANGRMVLTLRDFRPHVAALTAVNHGQLAAQIAQDYLLTYATGLNTYVTELTDIITATR